MAGHTLSGGGLIQHGAGLGVEAVAFVAAQVDDAFGAQPLEYFAHTEERQRDIQLFQLCVHTAHADAAAIAVCRMQGINHFEPNETGAQAKGAQQLANLFVTNTFLGESVLSFGRLPGMCPACIEGCGLYM